MIDGKKLQAWALHHHIEERSLQRFWSCFHNEKHEHSQQLAQKIEDFDEKRLVVEVARISLRLADWPECHDIHVFVYIPLYYDKGIYTKTNLNAGEAHQRRVGTYRLRFRISGEIDDEYFEVL